MTEHSTDWYRSFFSQNYLRLYEHELKQEQTETEISFVLRTLKELRLPPGARLLDLCCGQGRHAVPIAKQGYQVTGLDISEEWLADARQYAKKSGVPLELLRSDMRVIPFEQAFDAVIIMFTTFGYLESDEEDQKVLDAVQKALKPGGWFIVDLINREWAVTNYVENDWRKAKDGAIYLEHRELDLLTGRNHVSFQEIGVDGTLRDLGSHHIRLYTLTEMADRLKRAGLSFFQVYGDYGGQTYGISTRRMIIVAQKP